MYVVAAAGKTKGKRGKMRTGAAIGKANNKNTNATPMDSSDIFMRSVSAL